MSTKSAVLGVLVIAAMYAGCGGSGTYEGGTTPPPSEPSPDALVVQAAPAGRDAPAMEEQAVSAAVDTPPMPADDDVRVDGSLVAPSAPIRVRAAPGAVIPSGGGPAPVTPGTYAVTPSPAPPPPAMSPVVTSEERAPRREGRRGHRPREAPAPEPSMATPAAPIMEAGEGEADSGGAVYRDEMAPAPTTEWMSPPVTQVVQVVSRLTAATVSDVDRRANYLDYLSRHPYEGSQLAIDLSRRVRFRVVDGQDRPVHDAVVTVVSGGVQVAGRTHADGWWDYFPGVVAPQASGSATVFISHQGTTSQATVPIPGQGDGRDIVIRLPQAVAAGPAALDLAFLIDVTGSMGDELRYVNEEVVGIVARVQASLPQVQVRVAATFYRDRGDYVPIEQIPFSPDVNQFVARMRFVDASGGGDYPEDVNMGLAAALTTLQWSTGQAVRVLVIIGDAPPQAYPTQYTYREAMVDASRRGIRLLPVAASGADRVVEYLWRAMGTYTSTPYVYLTDDSGIGGSHMEADTDRVALEMFSDALTRMLIADLQGEGMHEPIEDVSVLMPGQ